MTKQATLVRTLNILFKYKLYQSLKQYNTNKQLTINPLCYIMLRSES